MRAVGDHRVFDRANWRRKARVPSWMRRDVAQPRPPAPEAQKPEVA